MDSGQLVEATATPFQLKELSAKHRLVVSLLVQGVPREVIAQAAGYTAEYVTWLTRQPLVVESIKELEHYADVQLMALAEKRTDAIREVLTSGSNEDRLKAAKLQLEATNKIGSGRDLRPEPPQGDRLELLAERLVGLLQSTRGRTFEGRATLVEGDQSAKEA